MIIYIHQAHINISDCAFPPFSGPRSSHCISTQGRLTNRVPEAFLICTGEEIESPVQEEQKMSILLLIQLGKRSVWDKARLIYHGEGNTQYRAMLIRALRLKQWLWEAVLPQIVSTFRDQLISGGVFLNKALLRGITPSHPLQNPNPAPQPPQTKSLIVKRTFLVKDSCTSWRLQTTVTSFILTQQNIFKAFMFKLVVWRK